MDKRLKSVLREIKCYYKRLLESEPKSFGDQGALQNLSKGVGVYVIYDKNNKPLYVGETNDLRDRLKHQLFYFNPRKRDFTNHALSSRLYEKFEKNQTAVIKYLRSCLFKKFDKIKEPDKRGKAKLLEGLVIVMLKPKIGYYKKKG